MKKEVKIALVMLGIILLLGIIGGIFFYLNQKKLWIEFATTRRIIKYNY